MRTYDIIVAIHQTRKMGDKKKFGPDSLDQWGAAAGVSGLSSQSAALNLARQLPDGWGIENEGSSYGERMFRKLVKIELPDGVEAGSYRIANVNIDGLHSTKYSCRDGMGSTVYCYTREARLMEPGEDRSEAIDRAINSGIILSVPGPDGVRHEVEAKVLAVSGIFGSREPEGWQRSTF